MHASNVNYILRKDWNKSSELVLIHLKLLCWSNLKKKKCIIRVYSTVLRDTNRIKNTVIRDILWQCLLIISFGEQSKEQGRCCWSLFAMSRGENDQKLNVCAVEIKTCLRIIWKLILLIILLLLFILVDWWKMLFYVYRRTRAFLSATAGKFFEKSSSESR